MPGEATGPWRPHSTARSGATRGDRAEEARVKVTYVCGPYRRRRLLNILRARSAALFVWQHGGVALCPHLNTAFFDGKMPDDVWLDGDLELLSRCDAIWAIPGWRESAGASAEVAAAERLG